MAFLQKHKRTFKHIKINLYYIDSLQLSIFVYIPSTVKESQSTIQKKKETIELLTILAISDPTKVQSSGSHLLLQLDCRKIENRSEDHAWFSIFFK